MISVGEKIYLNGIITKQNENPLSDIWGFCPAKGEIDSNAGKLERPTCMNCCIRKLSYFQLPASTILTSGFQKTTMSQLFHRVF